MAATSSSDFVPGVTDVNLGIKGRYPSLTDAKIRGGVIHPYSVSVFFPTYRDSGRWENILVREMKDVPPAIMAQTRLPTGFRKRLHKVSVPRLKKGALLDVYFHSRTVLGVSPEQAKENLDAVKNFYVGKRRGKGGNGQPKSVAYDKTVDQFEDDVQWPYFDFTPKNHTICEVFNVQGYFDGYKLALGQIGAMSVTAVLPQEDKTTEETTEEQVVEKNNNYLDQPPTQESQAPIQKRGKKPKVKYHTAEETVDYIRPVRQNVLQSSVLGVDPIANLAFDKVTGLPTTPIGNHLIDQLQVAAAEVVMQPAGGENDYQQPTFVQNGTGIPNGAGDHWAHLTTIPGPALPNEEKDDSSGEDPRESISSAGDAYFSEGDGLPDVMDSGDKGNAGQGTAGGTPATSAQATSGAASNTSSAAPSAAGGAGSGAGGSGGGEDPNNNRVATAVPTTCQSSALTTVTPSGASSQLLSSPGGTAPAPSTSPAAAEDDATAMFKMPVTPTKRRKGKGGAGSGGKKRRTSSGSGFMMGPLNEDETLRKEAIKEAERQLKENDLGMNLVTLLHCHMGAIRKQMASIETKLDSIMDGEVPLQASGGSGAVSKELAKTIEVMSSQVDELAEQKKEKNTIDALKKRAGLPWDNIQDMKNCLSSAYTKRACMQLARKVVNNYGGPATTKYVYYGSNFGHVFIMEYWHGRFLNRPDNRAPESEPTRYRGGFPFWQLPQEFMDFYKEAALVYIEEQDKAPDLIELRPKLPDIQAAMKSWNGWIKSIYQKKVNPRLRGELQLEIQKHDPESDLYKMARMHLMDLISGKKVLFAHPPPDKNDPLAVKMYLQQHKEHVESRFEDYEKSLQSLRAKRKSDAATARHLSEVEAKIRNQQNNAPDRSQALPLDDVPTNTVDDEESQEEEDLDDPGDAYM